MFARSIQIARIYQDLSVAIVNLDFMEMELLVTKSMNVILVLIIAQKMLPAQTPRVLLRADVTRDSK